MAGTKSALHLLGLSREEQKQTVSRATAAGLTPEAYIRSLVLADLELARRARTMTFAEIAGGDHNIPEADLDAFVMAAKAKRRKPASSSGRTLRKAS